MTKTNEARSLESYITLRIELLWSYIAPSRRPQLQQGQTLLLKKIATLTDLADKPKKTQPTEKDSPK